MVGPVGQLLVREGHLLTELLNQADLFVCALLRRGFSVAEEGTHRFCDAELSLELWDYLSVFQAHVDHAFQQ